MSELGTAATRQAILQTFDDGPSIVSYIGHGGIVVWASENVFNYTDVASLSPQAQQPILLTMNCLNGFFHLPTLDSLSEELVKADGQRSDRGVLTQRAERERPRASIPPSALTQRSKGRNSK